MIPLYYDLHMHSCLSPCGDDNMTPANLVGMAAVKGLDVIALTDHNSCKNCPAAMKHGEEYGVIVIPGMELTTSEEVHVVCLFPTLDDALSFDAYVYDHILPIKNKEHIFGRQQIMDAQDYVIGNVERLLISATDISFDRIFALASSYHGIAYPAHIDNMGNLHRIQKEHPYFLQCNIVSSSDAHYLEDINEPYYQLYSESRSIPDILAGLLRHA